MKLPDLSVFRHRAFARFWQARLALVLGWQIQTTAMGWQVYDLARDRGDSVAEAAFLLGVIGLLQFLPLLALSLVGGQAADRYDRKRILVVTISLKAVLAAGLVAAAGLPADLAIGAIFAIAALNGAIIAFQPAAMQALMPMLVPREDLPKAIALSSLAFTSASVAGPSLGGVLYALGERAGSLGPEYAYGVTLVLTILSVVLMTTIRADTAPARTPEKALTLIREGVVYVRNNKIVLGAMSLDLVVVFLAGAQALLPVFARDVLHVGETGLGLLRSAPALGMAIVGLCLLAAPIRTHVGRWMFGATFVFGVCTLVFGLSTSFWLTMAALAIAGAADMISVYVRQSLIQLATPDHMRGRVGAVSFIFISASNELGDFEAGVTARMFGPGPAVVIGGLAAIGAAAWWMKLFPDLARADGFEDAAERQRLKEQAA